MLVALAVVEERTLAGRRRARAPRSARSPPPRRSPVRARGSAAPRARRRRRARRGARAPRAPPPRRAPPRRARGSSRARRPRAPVSSITVQRERSAELTSKYGFSVVAPMSVTRPSSTACSTESCCALLKRWISSMKRIVRRPFPPSRSRARAITARTSSTRAETAEISSNAAPVRSATIRAIVVLPVPGGPKRIIDGGRSSSIARAAPIRARARAAGRRDRRARTAAGAPRAARSRPGARARLRRRGRPRAKYAPGRMSRRDEVTALLQALLRLDTVNPPGNETQAAELLRDYLAQNGVECELYARDPAAREPRRADRRRRRSVARVSLAHGHGARRSRRVGSRSVVGRPRRRRGVGSRRARHEGSGRGQHRRVRVARARGLRARRAISSSRRRRRGGRGRATG